jgi:pyridoxine/pyridoxamine 5'-phosphate oxidase
VDTLELWTEGANRVHDRAVWTRSLRRADDYSFVGDPWRSTRLNP